MTAHKLAVVHWFPLEQYPPATNLLDYFAAQPDWRVSVYSCRNDRGLPDYEDPRVSARRFWFPSRSLKAPRRWIAYTWFPIGVLLGLFSTRPNVLLYVEPHSALPAFLYCLISRRCRLFVHYHEYRDRDEYLQPGMRLVRLGYWIERRFLYRRAEWISQTNHDRNRLFHEDLPAVDASKLEILPNYPPREWSEGARAAWRRCDDGPLRLVYVGAVSLRDTFIGPLVDWMTGEDSPGDVTLDIYSHNNDAETCEFLESASCDSIRFHRRGIAYHDLPTVLVDHHVGLILYRANTRNYVYNASNKLFEYLAMGLDVWYPPQMLGVKPYAERESWPRVLETDFLRLPELDLKGRRDRTSIPESSACYWSDDALASLRDRMEGKAK